jgi:thioredoxin 1
MEILNNDTFSAKVSSGATLAVDFFAEWCGPCKMLSPVLESLAPEFEGKLEIVKVDIDEAAEIAQKYNVTSVPTIVFIKGGQEVDRMVGFQSKDSLSAKFNAVVS